MPSGATKATLHHSKRKHRKRFNRKPKSTNVVAREALHLAKKALKTHQPEIKFYDTPSTTSTTWSGLISDLIPITQGTTQSTRIGDEIIIKGVDLRYNLSLAAGTHQFRVMIFREKENTIGSVVTNLISNTTYGSTLYMPMAPLLLDFRHAYEVLYDECHALDSIDTTTMSIRKYIPVNKKCQFNANTSNAVGGGIFIFTCGDAVGATVQCAYVARVYYTDP